MWGKLPQAWRGLSTTFLPVGLLRGHNASVCLGGSHGTSSNINKDSAGSSELSAWHPPWSSSGHMSQGSWLASPHLPSATNLGLRRQMRNEAAHETPQGWVLITLKLRNLVITALLRVCVSCVQMSYKGLTSAVQWNWQSFPVALTALHSIHRVAMAVSTPCPQGLFLSFQLHSLLLYRAWS